MLVPPEPDFGAVVVVLDDDGFVVVVALLAEDELEVLDEELALDDEADDELDDDVAVVVVVVLAVVLVVVVVVACCADGEDDVELSRSPGFAIASATPATRTTTAAIRTGRVRDLIVRGERVTGVEPASPAWKAGALPLSYTRGPGGR